MTTTVVIEFKEKSDRGVENLLKTLLPKTISFKSSENYSFQVQLEFGIPVIIINTEDRKKCSEWRALIRTTEGLELSEDLEDGEIFFSTTDDHELLGVKMMGE